MTGILFEDILIHYSLKLKHALEETEDIMLKSKQLRSLADSSWQGAAAAAFIEKTLFIDDELNRAREEISEALKQLSLIEETV